jgi:hypothetical protein
MTLSTRLAASLLLVGYCSLIAACGEKNGVDAASGGQPGTGAAPSDGDSGGTSSGGSTGGASTGGASSGGASTGGSGGVSTGGESSGGSGGEGPDGTGGAADPFEGYPDWVPACVAQRGIAQCPSCMDPECIVCTYGTDEEIADSEASCTATPDAYADYCDCAGCTNSMGGACRYP